MPALDPVQWQVLSPYLDQALTLAEEERTRWLDAIRVQNPALADRLRKLLGEYRAANEEGFLEKSPDLPTQSPGLTGQIVGAYRLRSQIGFGGMGTVWLAERNDGRFERKAAVKFLSAALIGHGGEERFKREGAILGRFSHPNIAEMLDAGVTSAGQPYIILEYVQGEPIDRYCDAHKLDIKTRLSLFLDVLAAVAHAHASLIVHRDIKPSNVLVSKDGHVKLLDFGIAKLLEAEGQGAPTLLTRAGDSPLTPAYAAPEQVTGGSITTATDIYALGVLLYVLLTGWHPAGEGLHSPAELVKAIVDTEPAHLASVVAPGRQDGAALSANAANRGSTPEKLHRLLRGDLDSIALKALEKERDRRYASALDFAADVKRYLNREAVLAVPPSLAYRARKIGSRHRVVLTTASAVVLVLVVAVVVSIREGIRASREAAVAEAVNDFLQNDLLAQAGASAQSGPNSKSDPDLKVRTALDRAAERINGKFVKQPELEASIRDTVGDTYWDLGLYLEASKQWERALALHRQVLGLDHAKALKDMSRLGRAAALQGKYGEAEALESQVVDAQRRVLGPEHADTLASMNALAGVYSGEGKFAQAEDVLARALEIQKRVLGPEHPSTLTSMHDLAYYYLEDGKYAQAEDLQTHSLEIMKRVLGEEHPDTLRCMSFLAFAYDREGKDPQAETLEIETLAIMKRVLGPEHPNTLNSMNFLAAIYMEEGKYAEAEELFSESLEIKKRVLGPEHPDTAMVIYNLGCLAARRGDKDRAIALLKQSVDHGLAPSGDLSIEKDTDLASLHADPRFAALTAHAKNVAEAKQKAAHTQLSK
jgi:eukaryotic-like serine/threonine-protein kinase